MSTESVQASRRPGTVTFVGILLYIKAAVAAVIGIILLVEQSNESFREEVGRETTFLVANGIAELLIAALLVVAAWALLKGAEWARLFTAVVVAFRLAVAIGFMITHLGGSLAWNALISALLGAMILYFLYGDQRTVDWFEQRDLAR